MPPIETNEAPPVVGLEGTAFFLDLDAIAAETELHARAATLPAPLLDLIDDLSHASGGALALLSGRTIAELDAMVAPLHLPVAGLHGGERRNGAGQLTRSPVDGKLLGVVVADLTRFSFANPGTLVEVKTASVALHYAKRPELEPLCLALAEDLADEDPRIAVMSRKGELELALATLTPADAIRSFMAIDPFAGKKPIVIGAGDANEPAFATATQFGGFSVRLSSTEASQHTRYALRNAAALKTYLSAFLHQKAALPAA